MKLKGQAFDTFKLLIAALVAVSILGVMMSIIGSISTPGSDPTYEIQSKLNKAKINIGNKVTTSEIKFKNNDSYCISAIILNTGIQEDMVEWDISGHKALEEDSDKCISTGEDGGDANGKASVQCFSNNTCTISVKSTL